MSEDGGCVVVAAVEVAVVEVVGVELNARVYARRWNFVAHVRRRDMIVCLVLYRKGERADVKTLGRKQKRRHPV